MLNLNEVLSDFKDYSDFDDRCKVDIFSKNSEGKTALHWMAMLGDHNGISLLIDAGSSIDEVDNEGCAPIHEAVANRQITAVRALVLGGADLGVRNNLGQTPKDMAISDGYKPIVDFLNGWIQK